MVGSNRGICDQWLILGNQYNTVSTDTRARTNAGIQVDTIRVLDKEAVASIDQCQLSTTRALEQCECKCKRAIETKEIPLLHQRDTVTQYNPAGRLKDATHTVTCDAHQITTL